MPERESLTPKFRNSTLVYSPSKDIKGKEHRVDVSILYKSDKNNFSTVSWQQIRL
jgi:hypothetical protein